jgi:hypothetical protein
LLSAEFPVEERCIEGDGYAVVYWKHRWYRRLISTPFRDRIALCWDGDAPPRLAVEPFVTLGQRAGGILLKDIGGLIDNGTSVDTWRRSSYVNSCVTLDSGLEGRFQSSARKNLRKAEEDYDLQFVVNPPDIFEPFYALYVETRRRLGVLPYSRSFFRRVFDWRGTASVAFACRSGRTDLGYLICYLHGPEMISAHLAYDFNHRQKRITDFLFANAFRWGRANRYERYRFGADNANQTGLIQSKVKLGAVPYEQFDFQLPVVPALKDDPDSVPRRIIRGVPHPAFGLLHVLTYGYFR